MDRLPYQWQTCGVRVSVLNSERIEGMPTGIPVYLDDVLHSFGDELVEGVIVLLHETSDLWMQSARHTHV